MSLLKIARMGHPLLLRKCDPVPDPGKPEIRRLVADMMETMMDAPGVGLAAPQVYQPLRLFVFRVPRGRGCERDGGPVQGNAARSDTRTLDLRTVSWRAPAPCWRRIPPSDFFRLASPRSSTPRPPDQANRLEEHNHAHAADAEPAAVN